MKIDEARVADIPVIKPHGRLGDDDTDLLERVFELLSARGDRLIIDLSAIEFLSSSGLNTLVRITGQANTAEQQVAYAAPTPFVDGVFKTTRLTRFFDVFETIDEAVTHLNA